MTPELVQASGGIGWAVTVAVLMVLCAATLLGEAIRRRKSKEEK